MTKSGSKSASHTPMTPAAASRIQNATAKVNGGKVEAGSFAARAQAAGARNGKSGSGVKR